MPGLVHEALALRALDGRQATLAHGPGPGLEALDHGVEVEIVGHGETLADGDRRPRPVGPACADRARPAIH